MGKLTFEERFADYETGLVPLVGCGGGGGGGSARNFWEYT
jgi:hypothetical protein